MKEAILYSFWRSSCSWRVRIALEMKGISYRVETVDIMKGRQHETFAGVNPLQKVPALNIDGTTLIESYNIIQYLEETRPQKSIMPKDPIQRAKVREICEVIQSGIQPLQNVGVLKHLPFSGEEKKKWAQKWIQAGFNALEKTMNRSSGMYSVGDSVTIADCFLVPQVYNARKFGVDVSPYKTIVRVDNALQALPAFIQSHPHVQEDAPLEFKGKL